MKGGATGGGKSILVPREDINLHFTGDFHAITSAHNLLAAMLDNHIYWGNKLRIDPRRVLWRRVLDLNDRALRHMVIGLGGKRQGVPRETGFDITAASEVMAMLCLAEDADDLRARLVAPPRRPHLRRRAGDRRPTFRRVGAMMVLLRDALMPNLVQTCEGVPALVHGGPFANIAHGCNSVIATKMAMAHADWTITEAGFGFDLGAEKFFDIKCRRPASTPRRWCWWPPSARSSCTAASPRRRSRSPTPRRSSAASATSTSTSRTSGHFGETPVVALNRFADDTDEEIEVVRRACAEIGAPVRGLRSLRAGRRRRASIWPTRLIEHAEAEVEPVHAALFAATDPLKTKMEKVARYMYGAAEIVYTKQAEKDLEQLEVLGYDELPLCIAKTPTSLSDDPTLVGRPEDFEITVRGFIVTAGAGFVVPLLGDILRMPGLPRVRRRRDRPRGRRDRRSRVGQPPRLEGPRREIAPRAPFSNC